MTELKRLPESTVPADEGILIGRIGGPYGIKGWVRLISYADPQETIFDYGTFTSPWGQMLLEKGRPHGKGLVAKFEGVEDRNTAETIRNVDLFVSSSAFAELEPGEYYWHELVGLRVIDAEGMVLGRVDHLLETGAHDVIVVRREGGGQQLIPYVAGEIVQGVDLEAQTITVAWGMDY